MPIQELHHTLNHAVSQLRPKERVTRKRNFGWLLVGLFDSRSVHLSKVAGKIPGTAVLVSKTRRLQRWLANPSVRVRHWYRPIAEQIIARLADGGLRLLVDGSKVGFGHQLLLISVAYRKRALPLCWTWIGSSRGHSTSWKQRALLAYVHGLVPPGTRVSVAGDSEFGGVEVQNCSDCGAGSMSCDRKGACWSKPNLKVPGGASTAWCASLASGSGWRIVC